LLLQASSVGNTIISGATDAVNFVAGHHLLAASRGSAHELWEVQRPGNAIAIVYPSEHSAEAVGGDGQRCRSPGQERIVAAANFVLGFAIDEQRESRRKRKIVLQGAEGAKDGLASAAEASFHDRTFRAGPLRALTKDFSHLRAGKQRHVEVHGLLGFAFKREKRLNLGVDHFSTPFTQRVAKVDCLLAHDWQRLRFQPNSKGASARMAESSADAAMTAGLRLLFACGNIC
jgi:hypothetical protein